MWLKCFTVIENLNKKEVRARSFFLNIYRKSLLYISEFNIQHLLRHDAKALTVQNKKYFNYVTVLQQTETHIEVPDTEFTSDFYIWFSWALLFLLTVLKFLWFSRTLCISGVSRTGT